MSQLDIATTPATTPAPGAPWSTAYHARPPRPLEEVVRPYGATTTVGFVNGEGEQARLTYSQLARRAAVAAHRLRQLGVRPGEPVALTITNNLESITAALAVWVAGSTLVSLPLAPKRGQQSHLAKVGSVLAAMGCRHHLALSANFPNPPGTTSIPIAALLGDERVPDPEPAIPDVALVQFTSGSLGTPKGVAIGKETFAGHIRMISGSMGADPVDDRIATWLPMYHDLGFVCFFGSGLYEQVSQFHADPRTFVLNPALWLTLLAEERATISGAPNFGYRLASRVPYPDGLDLSPMRFCLNAAERVVWSDLEAFERRATPMKFRREAIMPAYGLAEGTVGVSANPLMVGPKLGPGGHVSLGPPLPGNRVSVATDTEPGTLLLDGEWLFEGYWTEDGFQPRPAGPFDTNDAAFLHDGELYVIGRHGEVASVGGHNVFAEDVEASALRAGAPAVSGCAAFKHTDAASGERFGLVLEVSPRAKADADTIARTVRSAVADEVGTRPTPLLVVQSGVIPRTSSGKPQRGNLRQACLDGELSGRRIFASLA